MLPEIEYHRPADIKSACELLRKFGKDALIIAGGTDVIVDLKTGRYSASHLISLDCVENIKGISEDTEQIQIGALTTITELLQSEVIKKSIPALSHAASLMASPQVRNIATVGGNIASAVPSADLPPVLIAADSTAIITDGNSERTVKISEFFLGPRQNCLKIGEVLTHIKVPKLTIDKKIAFQRFSLKEANALAVASVAVMLSFSNGIIGDAKIVLGAVAPTPLVAFKSSENLKGRKLDEKTIESTAKIAAHESKPISDIRGSAEYRRHLVEVLTRHALKELAL